MQILEFGLAFLSKFSSQNQDCPPQLQQPPDKEHVRYLLVVVSRCFRSSLNAMQWVLIGAHACLGFQTEENLTIINLHRHINSTVKTKSSIRYGVLILLIAEINNVKLHESY